MMGTHLKFLPAYEAPRERSGQEEPLLTAKQLTTRVRSVRGRLGVLKLVAPAAFLLRADSVVAWHLQCVWLAYNPNVAMKNPKYVPTTRRHDVEEMALLYRRLALEPRDSILHKCLGRPGRYDQRKSSRGDDDDQG